MAIGSISGAQGGFGDPPNIKTPEQCLKEMWSLLKAPLTEGTHWIDNPNSSSLYALEQDLTLSLTNGDTGDQDFDNAVRNHISQCFGGALSGVNPDSTEVQKMHAAMKIYSFTITMLVYGQTFKYHIAPLMPTIKVDPAQQKPLHDLLNVGPAGYAVSEMAPWVEQINNILGLGGKA